MQSNKPLKIEDDGSKITIRFPVHWGMFAVAVVPLVLLIAFSFGFREIIRQEGWFFPVFMLAGLVLLLGFLVVTIFFRKLVICKETRQITYYSLVKKTFCIDRITAMEPRVCSDCDGDAYYLVIWLGNKRMRVQTQSEAQSVLLRDELISLMSETESDFVQEQ